MTITKHECEQMREAYKLIRNTPYAYMRVYPKILASFIPDACWGPGYDVNPKGVPRPEEGRPYLVYSQAAHECPINFCPFCGVNLLEGNERRIAT